MRVASSTDTPSPRLSAEYFAELVERRLGALVPAGEGSGLSAAIRYALLAPGKRLRPLLTLLAATELEADFRSALDAGCAIEMVHAASLIVDDLPSMDNASSRRGKPATHIAFGEATAILASIALLARAHEVLAESAYLGAEIRCELVSILAAAIGTEGLSAGQHRDLGAGAGTDGAAIARANELKTGALFVASLDMAAAIARADAATRLKLETFGEHLGQAFQILDDLTGAVASRHAEDAGKPTLLSSLGLEETGHRLVRHVEAARRQVDVFPSLRAFLDGLFGEMVERTALRLVRQAEQVRT